MSQRQSKIGDGHVSKFLKSAWFLQAIALNKFAVSNHTAVMLGVHALRSYLKLICEYELHSLPNKS